MNEKQRFGPGVLQASALVLAWTPEEQGYLKVFELDDHMSVITFTSQHSHYWR